MPLAVMVAERMDRPEKPPAVAAAGELPVEEAAAMVRASSSIRK